jgi:F-type H+-transporting ATPase subunit delta
MISSTVISRYARSIVLLAIERDQLEALREDMRIIADACDESRDLRVLLKSPVVKPDKKSKILKAIFGGKVGEITLRFVDILVRKGREHYLPEVAKAVYRLYKEEKDIMTFHVSSAVKLDDAARAEIMAMASELHGGKDVELLEKVDPELIGGVILRHGDEQWDGSVVRRLHDLKREFSKNPYIAEI